MKSITKAMYVAVVLFAVGMVSGCGSSGSGTDTAALSTTPGTAAGTSSTSTPSAQLSAGAALYASNCAACHGAITSTSIVPPASLAKIKGAIAANFGGMGKFGSLSDADLQTIADAVNNPSAATATPTPTPAPTPTPTPTVDGATLYTANCSGCHGALATSSKIGVTLARLQTAISNNTGGMGSFASLSGTQQQAIVTALASPTSTPAPTPTPVTDGATLYTTDCAGCHGALASSAKAGATAARIQTAINNNTGGMGTFSALTVTQVSAIATALAGVTATPTPPPACGSCHAIPPATGHHSTHKSQNIACATCHGAGYSTTTFNAATHNNGVKNLTTTIGWNATSRSCSNSCHGNHSW